MSKRFRKQSMPRRAPSASPIASKIDGDLQNAVALHQRGQLVEAERIYREIVKLAPDHFDALHLLGVLKHQQGRNAEALDLINTALQMEPNEVLALSNRGIFLYALKRFDEALASCEKAIALKPDYPEALNNRGNALKEVRRLDEALASYDRAIALRPNYPEALNNRGNALKEVRRLDEALASYDRAIALKPGYANALNNRGNTLGELDRFEDALASYDRAIAFKPDYVEAINNRAYALHELKRLGDALTSYDRAIALKPDYPEAFNNRGNVLKELTRLDDALVSYDRAIALKPDYADAFNNRGNILKDLMCLDEALTSYDRAIALKPDYAEAFNNRAYALKELNRLDESLTSYDRAITLKPDYPEAFNNRGSALVAIKRLDEALASYDRAIALKPDYAEAFNNRGNALVAIKRLGEALASYNRAIALRPDYADAFYNQGIAFKELNRLDEALASCDKAISLKPDHADAFNNRGVTLMGLRRLDEALASYEQALAIKPDHRYAFSGLADCALKICDWTRTAKLVDEMEAHVARRQSIVTPFVLLCCSSNAALQLTCTQIYIEDKISTQPQPLWNGSIRHRDKIRVGYLSADFHHHATAFLMAELFELHDRSRFQVLGLSLGAGDDSDMRARLVKSFDQFHDVSLKSDRDAATLMNELQLDIAVDLKGYTRDSRPGILAHRPAPIQVNFLGYPGTMGAAFMDYIIADKIVLPFDQQPHYTEKIVHLPDSYQVNDSRRRIAAGAPTRRDAGLPDDAFVFCSFNNNYKITASVFDVWMRLLHAVGGSVLWLLRDNNGAERNLRKEAAARGIDPARLVFASRMHVDDHLARHRLADLFLDTLPVNAHTTASDALWAGLPLVTCLGGASRDGLPPACSMPSGFQNW